MSNLEDSISTGSQALLNKVLAERYLILEKIGQGGMAWVYQAIDVKEKRTVAIKVLLPHLTEDAQLRERFLHEARIQGKLKHPHIVELLDTVEMKNSAAIVMEWVNGENLKDFLERNKPPLPLFDIWQLLQPVMNAVGYAHQQGIVHRDLKPENFLVSWENGKPMPKVTDFGVAKMMDAIDDNRTRTNMIMGTVRYMSPEQIQDSKRVDKRTDIHSLGVCLYWMATGRFPYEGTVNMIMGKILTQDPVPATERYSDIDPRFAELIMHAIQKDPDRRPQSCEALAHAMFHLIPEGIGSADDTVLRPPPVNKLKTIEFDPSVHTLKPSPKVHSDVTMIRGPKKSGWLVAILLFVVLAATVFGVAFLGNQKKITAPPACQQGTTRSCYSGNARHRGVGVCKPGKQTCQQGKWTACKGSVAPQKERCNGKDDDCNGKVDDAWANVGKACALGVGECKTPGVWRCDAKQSDLTCVAKASGAPKGHPVSFQITPKEKPFKFRLTRGGKTTLADVSTQHCILLPKRKLRRRLRIKLTREKYQTCTIYLRSVPSKPLKIRMKRRTKWVQVYNYCLK